MVPSPKFLAAPSWGDEVSFFPDTRWVRRFRNWSDHLGLLAVLLSLAGYLNTIAAAYWPRFHDVVTIRFPLQSLSTLTTFMLAGLAVIFVRRFPHAARWTQTGTGALILLVGLVSVKTPEASLWRVDRLAGWVLLLLGFVVGAGGSRLAMVGYIRQFALFVIFFLCGLVLVGNIYELSSETPYLFNYVRMPWTSAAVGLVASHALLFQFPNFGVMRLISGDGFGCHITRRMLPSAIILLGALGGLLALGENHGWYPSSFGEGLYAVLAITGFSGILLFTAASLNRLDGERREREREVLRNQQQLQAVLDHTSSVICMKDLAGRYLMVNKSFSALFGKTPGECVGLRASDLYPADIAARIQETYDRAVETRQPVEAIETYQTADRGTASYLSARFPLLDAEGAPYAVCGIYTDITSLKRQEEEIQRLNESLRDKTLRQEAANQELEAFSYSVSHDLRAPLRHIAGFAQLLAQRNRDKLDDKSRHYLEVIETSVARMGALIDDLLSFSRASKTELAPKRVATSALVAEVRADLDAQRKGGPAVAWDIGALPAMHGDPAMLRLVWVNLLSNAVKYSGKNPAPRVTVGFGAAGGAPAAFFVKDNGAGFDMRYADKLFGVFQRLHSSQEYEGTGIGLAMVRRILERHGGRIWAEAAPGEGASFYFVVPETARDAASPVPARAQERTTA